MTCVTDNEPRHTGISLFSLDPDGNNIYQFTVIIKNRFTIIITSCDSRFDLLPGVDANII